MQVKLAYDGKEGLIIITEGGNEGDFGVLAMFPIVNLLNPAVVTWLLSLTCIIKSCILVLYTEYTKI